MMTFVFTSRRPPVRLSATAGASLQAKMRCLEVLLLLLVMPVVRTMASPAPEMATAAAIVPNRADGTTALDPSASLFKDVYKVGVLAIRGAQTAYDDFNNTFATYLTATAGKALGGVRFEMHPVTFKTMFEQVLFMDFIYLNPTAYSCIESEFGAQSLVSQVSRRKVAGNVYNLQKFGGVILARADNHQVNHIEDIRDKVVACVSISGLGAAQMQFREMKLAGMDHFVDPKQLVFTSNQGKIVNGVLNGQFDVGFVRTDQVERTKDANGTLVDPSLFKVIDPKPNLTIDGEPFPFESSTPLYPEWNLGAKPHVPAIVAEEVQAAMLAIDDRAAYYEKWQNCMLTRNSTHEKSISSCNDPIMKELHLDTVEGLIESLAVGEIATMAMETGRYSKWRPTLSYMQLRSMQQSVGFIHHDTESKTWRCLRNAELYDAITCPEHHHKKTKEEVDQGCEMEGLFCHPDFQCICSPCVKPLVCENNHVKMGDSCISYGWVVAMVLAPIALISILWVRWYIGVKRRAADSVWKVSPSELEFDNPPVVLGEGSFGLVLLADYRGTKVAVKRITPNKKHVSATEELSHVSSVGDGSQSIQIPYGVVDSCLTDGGFLSKDSEESRRDTSILVTKRRAPGGGFAGDDSTRSEGAESSSGGSRASRVSRVSRVSRAAAHISRRHSLWTRKADFVREMRLLSKLRHPSITTVMGAVISRIDEPMLIMEWMPNGSLYDVLRSETVHLQSQHYQSIIIDIIQGIRFLHSAKPQILHGDLKCKNVLIDSNFRASLCDFGLSLKIRKSGVVGGTKFWLAPELLRGDSGNTAATDIYSLGIVLSELYSRKTPYEEDTLEGHEILRMIANPAFNKRPKIAHTCPKEAVQVMKNCWEADPADRPTAEDIDLHVKMLDYTEFAPIGHKTKNQVLYDVFPRHIADALSAGKPVEPEFHESVAIYFSDIQGFTQIAATFSPIKVSSLLDRLYKAFDDLSVKHGIFKIETTGDAYMAVSNLVKDQTHDYVRRIAAFALDAVEAANRTLVDLDDPSRGHVDIRVGFHVGSVVSNVVGNLNPKFGIFGDSVNTSARMESTSEKGRIQCSEPAAELLREQAPKSIMLTLRGDIDVKGKGTMKTYWVSRVGDSVEENTQFLDSQRTMEDFCDEPSTQGVCDDNISV